MATKQEWLDAVDPEGRLVPREGRIEPPPVNSVLTCIIHQKGNGAVMNGVFALLNAGPVTAFHLPLLEGYRYVAPHGDQIRLDLVSLDQNVELPVEKRLAYEVLFGEADAVWPLIDAILEARERAKDGRATRGEMLEAIRGYTGWLTSSTGSEGERQEKLDAARHAMKRIVKLEGSNGTRTDE